MHLKLRLEHLGDVPVGKITAHDVQEHIAWLRAEYQPRRITGNRRPLAPKTIRNVYITWHVLWQPASPRDHPTYQRDDETLLVRHDDESLIDQIDMTRNPPARDPHVDRRTHFQLLASHVWTMDELLRFRVPPKHLW